MTELTVEQTISAKPFPLSSPRFLPFSMGRFALAAAMKRIDPAGRGRLLLPDYICRSVTDTLDHYGIHYAYYPVTRAAEPRFDEISLLPVEGVSSLLFVNYFGFPQSVEPLRDFCRERGIVLIEDNAHGFLGLDEEGNPLGGRGDIGVFSFPKTVYVPDGGGLVVNSRDLSDRLETAVIPGTVSRFQGTFLLKRQVLRSFESIGINSRIVGRLKRHKERVEEKAVDRDRGMSNVTQLLLERIEPRSSAESRRNQYREVVGICEEMGLVPLTHDPGESICPYLVPIVVEQPEARERAGAILNRRGWRVSHWPDLPSAIDRSNHPDAWWLRENIMAVYLRPVVV